MDWNGFLVSVRIRNQQAKDKKRGDPQRSISAAHEGNMLKAGNKLKSISRDGTLQYVGVACK